MEKTESIILGIVVLTAVIGLLLVLSESRITGQVYGGALKNVEYPYLEGRSARGAPTTPEGIEVATEEQASAEAIPYKTYNRMPSQIPSELTSCGQGKFEVNANFLRSFKETYPTAECTDYMNALD